MAKNEKKENGCQDWGFATPGHFVKRAIGFWNGTAFAKNRYFWA
jgi:hypothetical protein